VDARGRLDLFVEKADYLLAASIWERKAHVGFKMTFKEGEGSLEATGPTYEELEVVLIRLRPFLLDRSPVSIVSVHNLCERVIDDDELRDALRTARSVWIRQQRGGPLKFVLNKKQLPPSKVADLFLNSKYFHDDEEKKAELAAVPPPFAGFMKYLFLDFVMEATRQVGYMAIVIRTAIDRGVLTA
jgi:hypothetical protein